jgi:3-oxoacyl-[acyl-carrier-protein] synthase-3
MSAALSILSVHYPETAVSNAQLTGDTSQAEELYRRTGVRKRYRSPPEQTASDMGVMACEKLFQTHPTLRNEIDFLLFCTESPDYIAPSTACIMQDRLGLPCKAGALDIMMGCTGFAYGLGMAKALVESGQAGSVLVVSAETVSRVIDRDDLELQAIFSDGAAAALVKPQPGSNLGNFVFGTDGTGADALKVHGSAFRGTRADVPLPHGRLRMDGMSIFHFGLKRVPGLVEDVLSRNNAVFEDIDHFIFHQPSGIMLEALRKRIGIPAGKFTSCLEETGNMVGTSMRTALHYAIEHNRVKQCDNILLATFGVGFSWAGTIV